jgi:hypothetical protein
MSKVSNAQKRFRQGRITHKKLRSIISKEQDALLTIQENLLPNMQKTLNKIAALPNEPEHIHGEHCNHSEEIIPNNKIETT